MAKIIPVKNQTVIETISIKAAKLFKEKGFSATSMKDIGETIGVEAPSLYNHIRSKNEILKEICFRIANLFTGHINEVVLSKKPFLNQLELIIRFHIYIMLNEYQSAYVCEHEWRHLHEPYLSSFKTQRTSYRIRLANIIEQGIINKEFNNVNPSVAVLCILSAIGGIEYWHKSRKNVDVRSLEENMVTILLQGIKR